MTYKITFELTTDENELNVREWIAYELEDKEISDNNPLIFVILRADKGTLQVERTDYENT